jgi:hypothetical protein
MKQEFFFLGDPCLNYASIGELMKLSHFECLIASFFSFIASVIPRTSDFGIMHSPGNNHALALHSDGTLVAWGDNAYGQLNLPANITYTDIDAGRDFSIGLTESDSGNHLGHGGSVYARGKDDFGQVTGMNSLMPGCCHRT